MSGLGRGGYVHWLKWDWCGSHCQLRGAMLITDANCCHVWLELCGVSFCLEKNYRDIETMRYGVNIVIFDTIRYIVPALDTTLISAIVNRKLCWSQWEFFILALFWVLCFHCSWFFSSCQEIGLELEHLRDDLLCVQCDVRP